MTLTKSRSRQSNSQRKRSAAHHKRSDHYLKPYWPYLPIIAIISLGLVLNTWLSSVQRDVLGYATDMSTSGLLSSTNAQRSANGLGSLTINSKLNAAAQSKAQDMMTNNYWAHVSPTGVTPWYWITHAGYSYQSAGENLAYGFATSTDTITGWMNSAGHKANILNTSYKEVGFGIVNAPNYQSTGPQTIVVAMYAQPYTAPAAAPVATPATTTPTAKATVPSTVQVAPTTPKTTPTPAPAPETVTTKTTPGPTAKDTDTATPENTSSKTAAPTHTTVVPEKEISRVQVITSANVAWTQFAISMVASIALLMFLLRHSFAWHKFLIKGERFVLHHPMLDIGFVTIATLGFILAQTSGFIR